jgi:hypothetical protein
VTVSLLGLDPATYAAHALHGSDRSFVESNCYTDVWIELLHGVGLDPTPLMAFCLAIDFEVDQFTFFKPPPQDIERLYGIEIQELTVYRPLHVQAAEQVARGATVIPELDAWFLPDTAGTTYRSGHAKTSVAIESIDIPGRVLRYFHNAGYFQLEGEDFDGAFQLGDHREGMFPLPPYTELVRIDKRRHLPPAELRAIAGEHLAAHLRRRPVANPVHAFGERLAADLPTLLEATEDAYHAYTFSTVRQIGASFELGASFLRWLGDEEAATAALGVTEEAKMLMFKLVRAAARKRPFDVPETLAGLASAWDATIPALAARY